MHLSSEVALDYIEGRLVKDQETFWKQHLENCNDCTQDVAKWLQIGVALKRSHLTSAPDQDLQKALAIFPQQPKERQSLRSILATLVFDSFVQPAMAGARGT